MHWHKLSLSSPSPGHCQCALPPCLYIKLSSAFSRLPDVFIRCCRGAKLQINKAISTSQPLTLTREDLLVATAAQTHGDLIFFFPWLAEYLELHRSMALCCHRAQPCHLRGWGDCDIKVCSHFTCQRGLTFSTSHHQPSSSGGSAVGRQLILNQQ